MINPTKSKSEIKKARSSKWNWRFVAKSYLALAYIGIKELKEKHYREEPNFLWRVSNQAYDAKLLLISIIWNIKHAIELVMKGFHVAIKQEYFKGHYSDKQKKLLYDTFNLKGLETKKDGKLRELVGVIANYKDIKINGYNIIPSSVNDKNNVFLRYPETDGVVLDLHIFQRISDSELDKLLKDIEILNRRIAIPGSYKNMKSLYDVEFKKV